MSAVHTSCLDIEKETPASLSDPERITWIRSDRWINYERAQDVIARLTDLLSYPARDRMPCLLIFGSTGMGKTKIVRKFVRDHPAVHDSGVGVTRMPVVSFQMPPSPDEREFYSELFRALGAPSVPHTTTKHTRDACRNLLHRAGTRMLIVDEIHSMLAGTARAQRVFLNTLRFLANDLRIPLVCAGTDEARIALLTDAQLAERFDAFELFRWKDDAAFRRLLVSCMTVLPLRRPSQIDTPSCRSRILKLTEGVTNRIFRLIETAAVKAIENGSECITEEIFTSGELMLPLVSMDRKSTRGRIGV